MSYLVLARKHRPQNFDEIIGQDHITDLLKKAIQSDRVTHSYLFCGPRGTGKTSCARVLAKSLNCEKGPTVEPCQKCSACQEITKGTSFDVLEIDGASNRGIDEIRALRENVKFAPSYGRYKIYIVDEVHMLTMEAFNALLKTLEEPPEHVKFIFATTVPNKVPATIISRCQRFDFKRIPIQTIIEALSAISKKEKFKIKPDALYAIAKAAQGSLRDALSILDQLSALGDEGIDADDVCSMLGIVETQLLFELVDAVGQKNASGALETLELIVEKGKDIRQLMRDLVEHFRHLMIIKVGGKSLGKLVDYPVSLKEMLLTQCGLFTLKEILAAIDVLIETQETARITESLRLPLEVALAKLTYQEEPGQALPKQKLINQDQSKNIHGVKKNPPANFAPANVLKNDKGQVGILGKDSSGSKENEEFSQENAPDDDIETDTDQIEEILTLEKIQRAWDALTYAVSREKMSLATFLQEGAPMEFVDSFLKIGFPPQCKFHKETLEDKENVKLVEDIFSRKLKSPVFIRYDIIENYVKQEEDEVIKSTLDAFKGKVVNRWHNDGES